MSDLQLLPALQRVFLSHNRICNTSSIQCLFEVVFLIELSLDGNPIADRDRYRRRIIRGMPGLRHLDLKRITEEERAAAAEDPDAEKRQVDMDIQVIPPSPSNIIPPLVKEVEVEKEEEGGDKDDVSPVIVTPPAILELARQGRLPPSPPVFHLEERENALVVVGGEVWGDLEGVGEGITELCCLHVPMDFLSNRLCVLANRSRVLSIRAGVSSNGGGVSSNGGGVLSNGGGVSPNGGGVLSGVRCLRMFGNDCSSLKGLDWLWEGWMGGGLELLTIQNNPICTSSLLRSYLIHALPRLQVLNEVVVLPTERQAADVFWRYTTSTSTSKWKARPYMAASSDPSPSNWQALLHRRQGGRDYDAFFDHNFKAIIAESIQRIGGGSMK